MKLFVPGRLCILGEHSDWAGGYRRTHPAIERGCALVTGTEQGIHAEVGPHPTSLVLRSTNVDGSSFGPVEIPITREALLDVARAGGFWSYVAGVAMHVHERFDVRGGLTIHNFATDLPIRKGLSSSAAICVLAARAFNRVYGLGLSTRDEMEIAYRGEIVTPSRCGRMDQACAFGPGRPVRMLFDGDGLDVEELPVARDLHFVIVDLRAGKDTRRILACLHRSFPVATTELDRGLHALLGPINRRIAGDAIEAMRSGDAARLGACLSEAQEQFDRLAAPACPEELAAPVLHRVLAYPPIQRHVWGGKGVGSQGDGSAQLLARGDEDRQAVIEAIERDLSMPCLRLTVRGGSPTASEP